MMNNILKLAFVLLSTSLFSQTDNLGIPKLDREKIGKNINNQCININQTWNLKLGT